MKRKKKESDTIHLLLDAVKITLVVCAQSNYVTFSLAVHLLISALMQITVTSSSSSPLSEIEYNSRLQSTFHLEKRFTLTLRSLDGRL